MTTTTKLHHKGIELDCPAVGQADLEHVKCTGDGYVTFSCDTYQDEIVRIDNVLAEKLLHIKATTDRGSMQRAHELIKLFWAHQGARKLEAQQAVEAEAYWRAEAADYARAARNEHRRARRR